MRILTWALMIFMAIAGACQAQDNAAPVHKKKKTAVAPAKPKLMPIDIQTFGWGRHATNGYYYNGLPLENLQQFKDVIDPLGDAQASELLRSSANNDAWGTGLFWGGLALTGAAWVDFAIELGGMEQTTTNQYGVPTTTLHDPDLGPFAILLGVGTITWVGGLFLQIDSINNRYDAVNRYNYVVQHNNSLSFMFMPDTHQPGLVFTQRF